MTLVPTSTFPAPEELNTIWKLCERIADTEFVPRSLKGRPAAIACAVLFGRELGIGPMQALQSVQVIEGKPSASPELMRALIRRAGHELDIDASPTKATISGKRCDTGEQGSASFTLQDAVKARLCRLDEQGHPVSRSKDGKPLPWENYTEDMLVARATSRLARRLFSDVIAGVSYVPEEMASTAPERPSEPVIDVPPHDEATGELGPALEASLAQRGIPVPDAAEAPPAPVQTVRGPPMIHTPGLDQSGPLTRAMIDAAIDPSLPPGTVEFRDDEGDVVGRIENLGPGPNDVPLFEPPDPPWERTVREDPEGTPVAKARKGAGRAQEIADRNAGRLS